MWNCRQDLAENYIRVVNQCLSDKFVFDNFKSNIDYISIVGTPLPKQLMHFLKKLQNHRDIASKCAEFQKNDLCGNPPHIIPEAGLSMGTIRYLFSLCYLREYFRSLDNMVISELGVGYGGLAFVVGTYYKPSAYHLIDIPPVQRLAQKYLSNLNIPSSIEPPPEKVDLFISEFCLSEFDDEDMYNFYDKYVKNAANVFLTMNLIDENRKERFIKYVRNDFSLKIIPETHGTDFPAYLIVGTKRF